MNSTLKPKCLSFPLSVLYLKLKKISLQPKETQKETEEWKTCETMMKYRSQIIPQFTQAASIASKPNKALLISGLRGSNFEECGKVIEAELEKAQLGKDNIVSVQLFLRDLRKVVIE